MKLFLIERATLRELNVRSDGPAPGDAVAYWRHAQDADGSAAKELKGRGIIVEWAEGRISQEMVEKIDTFVDTFGYRWHLHEGTDVTTWKGFSFAEQLTKDLIGRGKINFLVRYGVIFEQLFKAYPEATEVVTDFLDGTNWLIGTTPNPHVMPRRRLLEDRAKVHGRQISDIEPAEPLPPVGITSGITGGLSQIFKAYVGGFRLRYLWPRLKHRFIKSSVPRIYIFVTQGLAKVCTKLTCRQDVEIFCDRPGLSGVTPLRYEHMLALPPVGLIRAMLAARTRIKGLVRKELPTELTNFGGIDFSPYFADILHYLLRVIFLPTLIAVAQGEKLLRLYRPNLIVINGEGSVIARLMASMNEAHAYKVVFIDHSNTLVPYGYRPTGRNFENVIYVAQGLDHVASYGAKLPPERKPERPVLTNPTGLTVAEARHKRKRTSQRRILLTNYSGAATYSVARIPFWDIYMIELFSTLRPLLDEGYRFTYRGHPGYGNRKHVSFLLDEFGLSKDVRQDTSPTFADALIQHDLVVSNVSDILYQTLHAGWPAVFYEPAISYRPEWFVGLPAVTDIDAPIATTPEQLALMIKEGIERPDSLTARFPELFNTIYANRFLGRDADRADEILANFIAERTIDAIPVNELMHIANRTANAAQ